MRARSAVEACLHSSSRNLRSLKRSPLLNTRGPHFHNRHTRESSRRLLFCFVSGHVSRFPVQRETEERDPAADSERRYEKKISRRRNESVAMILAGLSDPILSIAALAMVIASPFTDLSGFDEFVPITSFLLFCFFGDFLLERIESVSSDSLDFFFCCCCCWCSPSFHENE